MNANVLKVLKEISGKYGEGVLGDAKKIKALFSDLAKDEPKPLRAAFCLCIEGGAYNALKTAAARVLVHRPRRAGGGYRGLTPLLKKLKRR